MDASWFFLPHPKPSILPSKAGAGDFIYRTERKSEEEGQKELFNPFLLGYLSTPKPALSKHLFLGNKRKGRNSEWKNGKKMVKHSPHQATCSSFPRKFWGVKESLNDTIITRLDKGMSTALQIMVEISLSLTKTNLNWSYNRHLFASISSPSAILLS